MFLWNYVLLLQNCHWSGGISEAQVSHHQQHFSPLSPAHFPSPMWPMMGLPLAPFTSSAKWWRLSFWFDEVVALGERASQVASNLSWRRAWAESEQLQVPPSSRKLCVRAHVGVGEGTGGHANPWNHSERRCPTGTRETTKRAKRSRCFSIEVHNLHSCFNKDCMLVDWI